MSITVVTARDEFGAPTTREVYEEGAKFVNNDGNLDIVSAKPQLLATYGSGNWLSVHVGDYVNVIVEKPAEDSDDDSFSFGDDSDSDSDSDSSSDFSFGDDTDSTDTDSTDSETDGASTDDSDFSFGDDTDSADSTADDS